MLWVYAIVFFLAFSLSLAVVPVARWLSFRVGAVSIPGGRRLEKEPMPKLGSLSIFVAFIVTVIAAQFLPVPRQDPNEIIRLTGLIIGSSFVFLVWFFDDIFEFNWFWQALAQLIAGGISIFFLIFIEFFNNPLTGQQTDVWPFAVTVVLSLFWFGMMINTMNFLDGMDGLAAGVAVIAGLMLFFNSAFKVSPAQSSVALLPLAMTGACLGFLMYNFFPARIYLGGGAPLLGYWLAALSIIGGAKMATILLVLGLPLMDAAWQAFTRLMRGQNPMQGDRGHLHFRLLDRGILSHRQIVLLYYFFCAFFGILTLVLESQLYKFIAFGVMLGLISLGFFMLLRLPHQSSSSEST
jgi:UDP-GlcNAc:undecaprenyl-phosphate/decaprenyl-phosphate GlcNAc-1-phosphate transferase